MLSAASPLQTITTTTRPPTSGKLGTEIGHDLRPREMHDSSRHLQVDKYLLHGRPLATVTTAKHLGITVTRDLSWDQQSTTSVLTPTRP